MKTAKILSGFGNSLGFAMLLLATVNDLEGCHWLVFVFPVILLASLAGCVLSLWSKRKRPAAIMGTLFVLLLLSSFLPIYGRHIGMAGEPGGGYHRHIFWDVGHVH